MNVFAVDDRPVPLEALEDAIRQAEPEASVFAFQSGEEALSFAESTRCDAAFVDVQMPGMSGLEFAQRLKAFCPKANIIFATGYSDYMENALSMHVSGYLMKPVTPEGVREELDNLRHPVLREDESRRVWIRAFGAFDAFIDGRPVTFRHSKTRELLAFLIDRRDVCSNDEINAALWGGGVSGSYFRELRRDLLETFRTASCADIFLQQWGRIGVNADKIACDYYDYLRGLPRAVNDWQGEYMSQFPWAEPTRRKLTGKA